MVVTVLGLDDHVHETSDGKAGTNDNRVMMMIMKMTPIFLLPHTSTISNQSVHLIKHHYPCMQMYKSIKSKSYTYA